MVYKTFKIKLKAIWEIIKMKSFPLRKGPEVKHPAEYNPYSLRQNSYYESSKNIT